MFKLLQVLICLLVYPLYAAELQVPEPFDVLSVNGKESSSSLQRKKVLPLQVGRNVIVIEYDQLFDAVYGDSHDRIQSKPFALIFDAQADDRLTLVEPQFDSGTEAGVWAVAPAITVQNANKQAIKVDTVPVQKIAGEWLLPGASVAALTGSTATIKPALSATTPAAQASNSSAVPATPAALAAATHSGASTVAPPDTLQMLYYFWQQATPEQRAQFLQSVSAGK
jgi:uncharacterized protein